MDSQQLLNNVNNIKEIGKEAGEALVKLTETQKDGGIKNPEAVRLARLIYEKTFTMTADYGNTIKYLKNGSLLARSMRYAYSRACNDIVNLLIKESSNEKPAEKVTEKSST